MAKTSSSNALYTLTGIVSDIAFKNDRKGNPYASFKLATQLRGRETVRTTMAFGKNCHVITGLSEGDSVTINAALDGGTFRMAGVPQPKAKEAVAA